MTIIDRHRLIYITGPAGTGKTRLALELMSQVQHHFSNGAYAVHLASVSDPGLVPSTLLQPLKLAERPLQSAVQTLITYLRDKELFLWLDNFEHVADAAPAINELLHQCHGLTILVTSRVGLQLSGETRYLLQPLAFPEPVESMNRPDISRLKSFPAIELFIDRARQFNSEFDLTETNASTLYEICRKLDGLPPCIGAGGCADSDGIARRAVEEAGHGIIHPEIGTGRP